MEYGNLAYEEEYDVPLREQKPQKHRKQVRRPNGRLRYIRYICAITVMSLAAGFMISTFVAVHETRATVAALEDELAEEEAITSQKAFDLDHSVDLATIEEEATARLGMQRPESYQTVYVNVEREDVAEKTADEVENAGNTIAGAFKSIIGNIVEFFSIK